MEIIFSFTTVQPAKGRGVGVQVVNSFLTRQKCVQKFKIERFCTWVDTQSTQSAREGLNKNINKNGGIFHGGGGGLPIPPKLLILYQKIKTPQTDPNALKHEINQ